MLYHVPLVKTDEPARQIEFCHICCAAVAGTWKKERNFCFPHIKLNIFLEGEFSVFTDEKCYRPTYGDLCVLPPFQIHCGQILQPTFTNYYQLDIGLHALDAISDGAELIQQLIRNSREKHIFFRPAPEDRKRIIRLAEKLESAIVQEHRPLALAYTIEIISAINAAYDSFHSVSPFVLSKLTLRVIHQIETHYPEDLKISELAAQNQVSASYLSRLFKREVGIGVHEYLTNYRILQAAQLLKTHSVTEAGFLCGFAESSHFIAVFKKYFACTPMQYKQTFPNPPASTEE